MSFVAVLLPLAVSTLTFGAEQSLQPNIILVMADDMGWSDKVIREGQMTKQAGHVIDFMATCLDVAGVDYPVEFQGRKPLPLEGKSLLQMLKGKNREGHELLGWSEP